MDKDKIINSRCYCNKNLSWSDKPLLSLHPCEHIIHRECFKQLPKKICPICNTKLEQVYTEKQLLLLKNTNKEFYQKYVDIVSIRNFDELTSYKINGAIKHIIPFGGVLFDYALMKGLRDGINLIENLFNLLNVNVITRGLNKIKKGKKVYIANHTTHLDFMVLFYLLRCGFLSSRFLTSSWFGRKLLSIMPILLVDRDKKNNNVQRMKKYIERYGSICLFPEGMISHPDTIIKFRTGAFYTGYPVYPIVIRYEPIVYDSNIGPFVMKMASNNDLNIIIDVLDPEYPPFNNERIEKVRSKMAQVGNFGLSRISNRDILEEEE